MIKLKDITNCLEAHAPLALQESYDNSGLLIGDPNAKIHAALVSIDVTEEVVDEAILKNCSLIVAHHPVIFSGLKKLTGTNYTEKLIVKAIKNDIAIYAGHTNFDTISAGVNAKICDKLGLLNTQALQPATGQLKKLVTFIPAEDVEKVRKAVFNAGAGNIGNYDSCGYNIEGIGSFRGNSLTKPYVGEKGKVHFENEIRFETIFPVWLKSNIVKALIDAHPYEEVAYDIYPLENEYNSAGAGMIGELPDAVDEKEFLELLKNVFLSGCIRHTALRGQKVFKVAVCGGAGSFLLNKALQKNADFYVSADFKYHQFFDADGKIVIADVGHYESEQFTKELFYELLMKNFPKFAIRFSEVNSNPIYYF